MPARAARVEAFSTRERAPGEASATIEPMLALALLATLAPRQDPPVDTFSSPSGALTLTVTRKGKKWNGVVELVLVHDGVEAWRVEHELGLREACVGDDGRVAGFGYTGKGHDGYPGSEPDYPKGEDLRVFVLDAKGALVLDESHRRGAALYPDSDPNPVAAGAFLVPDLRRFVVRVHDEDLNRGAESWWSYDLDSGASLARVRPRIVLGLDEAVRGLVDARAVPGTPLVLVHWFRSVHEPRALASKFQLVDAEIRAVWTLDFPHDLDSLTRRELDLIDDPGNILATSERAFDLRLIGEAARVSFSVERRADGWTVSETSRLGTGGAEPAKPKPRSR